MDGRGLPEVEKGLDAYIFDYLRKQNMAKTANTFLEEKKVATNVEIIEAPGGFLYEWWSIFWDVFAATTNKKHSQGASAYPEQNQSDMKRRFVELQEQMQRNRADLQRSTNAIFEHGMHQERMGNHTQMHSQLPFQVPVIGRTGVPNSAVYNSGPLNQGNPFSRAALEHMQQPNQQSTRNILMDPSLCDQNVMQMKFGLAGGGMNEVASGLSLQDRHLTNHPQLIRQNEQQIIAEAVQQGTLVNANYGNVNPQRAVGLLADNLEGENGIDGSIQATSPQVDKARRSSTKKPLKPKQQQHEQPEQNTKRRKPASRAGNGACKGVIASRSTPSALTSFIPADKFPLVQSSCDAQRLASDANQTDDGGATDMLDLIGDPAEHKTKGITFQTVFTLNSSSKKIVCCDFSSDGMLLASAGHENKVFLWNMDNISETRTWEAHSSFITDIRFRPNSSMLATSSSDKTVQLWNASETKGSLQTFTGHGSQVTSVDFHPKSTEYLCSSDDDGKIFFWTVGQPNSKHISKVSGRGKVRFQPLGNYLASAAENIVNIIQVERDESIHCLKDNTNNNVVQSLCWNENGDYLASVSEDCVKVWSVQGQCIRELSANQNHFRSCTFHPKYPNTLVIGGYQTLTLWDIAENKTMLVQAHGRYIADLEKSRATGLVASASHDGSVKTWR